MTTSLRGPCAPCTRIFSISAVRLEPLMTHAKELRSSVRSWESAAQGSGEIGNQLRQGRVNDVAGCDHRGAAPAARSGHENRTGLRDESIGEGDRGLRGFARRALTGPADRPPGRGQFDKPAQRGIVLHKSFALGQRLQNFCKLLRARGRVGGQRAFHEVGNAFLLKSLERIGDWSKDDGSRDCGLGFRRRRLRDYGAQSGANALQNPLPA